MEKSYKLSIHLFRRDLRLHDNSALIKALSLSTTVIPAFIFDPKQIQDNAYKSNHALEFMTSSLKELDQALQFYQSKLYFFYGDPIAIIEALIKTLSINAVFFNRDYTPFSQSRDQNLRKLCKKHHLDFHCYADALLNEPEEVLKSNGAPYTIFTPAFHKARQLAVSLPIKNDFKNYYKLPIKFENNQILQKLSLIKNPALWIQGGRTEGKKLLKKIFNLTNYQETRDFPALKGTTYLSAHHKFGTLSIREVYAEIIKNLGKSSILIRELYWRDFFTHIGFHFPHVFQGAFHSRYDQIPWENKSDYFQAWCEGETGFPLVDAGMRQLNQTGYMHNRVRMVVASFLVKDLHIDWRWGEKYFANKLVDYDPCVNNGNWQWAASTGCDAQPYFRIFNPWLQQKKFDNQCLYIKHFIPALQAVNPAVLHQLFKTVAIPAYPPPIVSHAAQALIAKKLYKQT